MGVSSSIDYRLLGGLRSSDALQHFPTVDHMTIINIIAIIITYDYNKHHHHHYHCHHFQNDDCYYHISTVAIPSPGLLRLDQHAEIGQLGLHNWGHWIDIDALCRQRSVIGFVGTHLPRSSSSSSSSDGSGSAFESCRLDDILFIPGVDRHSSTVTHHRDC